MSARTLRHFRTRAQQRGETFPPPGPPLPPFWVWLVYTPRLGAVATHPTAPLEVTRKKHGWHARVKNAALRQVAGVYYADGATGIVASFSSALDAANAAWTYWQESTRRRLDPAATYVQVTNIPGLRWEQSSTPAGEGFVWLRPAFVAVRAPVEMVEPWR